MNQKMLEILLFWLEWVFPHTTPFVQAHTCRSHDFYYKLALVPVFTEPTFVLSTTSSKVNTAPLAIITAQVWHQNHSDSGSCCKICQSESFTSQALQFPLQKCSRQDLTPAKSLFCSASPWIITWPLPRQGRDTTQGFWEITQEENLSSSRIITLEGTGRKKLRKIISTSGLGPALCWAGQTHAQILLNHLYKN